MHSLNYWLWISVLVSLASSSILRHRAQSNNDNDLFFTLVPESAIEILQPPSSLELSWPAIRSVNVTRFTTINISLSHDLTASTLPVPVCNGNMYGFNLDVASCHEAWTLIPRDTIARTFGTRGSGIFDIPTPFLFMSSNGLCTIEIDLYSDDTLEIATGYDVAISGLNVLRTCVQGTPNRGGVTTDIGHNKRLGLDMRAYKPMNLHCMDSPIPAPALPDCRAILDLMPASVDPQVFGLRGEPSVAVQLPKAFTAASKRCVITVSTNGAPSYSAWYAMYTAATAIDAMCVRQGKAGIVTALGDASNLVISIKAGESLADVAATA